MTVREPTFEKSFKATQKLDEAELLRWFCKTRDPRLRERLADSYAPLARSLALRYVGGSEPIEDLIQVANLGLVKAIDGYDPARGRSFNAYAVPTILGELRRHFRDHAWRIHLPRRLQELTIRVNKVADELREETGSSPSVTQIAERLDASEEEVLEAIEAGEARHTLSLDMPRIADDSDSAPVVESIGTIELGFDAVEARLATGDAPLDEREWRVLRLRFADELNQYEIGAIIGVSQMQVSRILRKALHKLLAAVRGEETDNAPTASGATPTLNANEARRRETGGPRRGSTRPAQQQRNQSAQDAQPAENSKG